MTTSDGPTPSAVSDGLALYRAGEGPPLLLMPYPHGFTQSPSIASPLARLLMNTGRTVVTFDPPGAYASTRPADVTLAEMLSCAEETLDHFELREPIDVVGHSMGGQCALAFALDRRHRVDRLTLVATPSGYPAVRRWGQPASSWRWWRDADYWRFIRLGLRLRSGKATLADHKRLARSIWQVSFVDPKFVPEITLDPADERVPAPVRDLWSRESAHIDLAPRLGEIGAETLLLFGRHDPQTPPAMGTELAAGISGSRLLVFECSGHSPFIEEPAAFAETVSAFFRGSI